MRRTETADRRKKMAISIFFVVILVASTAGFVATFNTKQDTSYNGYDFELRGNQWVAEVDTAFGTEEFVFYHHPLDLRVQVSPAIVDAIKAAPTVVLVFDPNITDIQYAELGRFQLNQYLVSQLGKNVEHAITAPHSAYTFPVVQCIPDGKLYILYQQGNVSSASLTDNCVTLESFSGLDYLEYSESIVYRLLGVIQ